MNEANKNRVPILIGVGGLLLLAFAITAFQGSREREKEKLNQRFLHAADAIATAREGDPGPERAKKITEARETLQALYQDTINTPMHPFVLGKLADLETREKNYVAALGYANELVAAATDPATRNAAYYRLMKLHLMAYQVPEALAAGRKGLEETDGPFTPLIKAEVERMRGGSLNGSLTEALKAEELTEDKDK